MPAEAGLFELLAAQGELKRALGYAVDLVPDTGLKPTVRSRVERELVVV